MSNAWNKVKEWTKAATAGTEWVAEKWKQAANLAEHAFRVLTPFDGFELRAYQPYVVAATWVEGTFASSASEGFRRLARYIDGGNAHNQTFEMNAPVSQNKHGDRWRIAFALPAQVTLATLPKPLDSQVTLWQIPAKQVVARRFAGLWSERTIQTETQTLVRLLAQQGYTAAGEPVFARYNPPYVPFFLRRNEILISIVS